MVKQICNNISNMQRMNEYSYEIVSL